jgi:glycosyltransferase involved in cell wall biosynthesis
MRVLAIVPAYNEEGSLAQLLSEIRKVGHDAIVINDASTDNTEQVARAAGVPIVSLSNNLGIGGAVQAGFLYAARNQYDAVVQLDGDGQHDPDQIRVIIEPIETGKADCVVGSRFHPAQPDLAYKTPLFRRLGMHFSTGILFATTGLKIRDTTSGFRALNREAFLFFSKEYPSDHPEAEALLVLHESGFRIIEVPVTMRARASGSSLFSFFRAMIYPMRVTVGFMAQAFKGGR